jgi:hypothetical protein
VSEAANDEVIRSRSSVTRATRGRGWEVTLGPRPVTWFAAILFAAAALYFPGSWVATIALVWLASTIVVACGLLLAAAPLTPLRTTSHLLMRLEWLSRFVIAAVLLCVSAFVGSLAGAQVRFDDAGVHLGQTGTLLRSVLSIAIGTGLFLFLIWLAADVWRLGQERRLAAVLRGVGLICHPWPVPPPNPFVVKWVIALTSPFWLTLALLICAGWSATLFFEQGGLTFG